LIGGLNLKKKLTKGQKKVKRIMMKLEKTKHCKYELNDEI
jgi:hypothetical protein